MSDSQTTNFVAGPWMAEHDIPEETEERGLAVIAVNDGYSTPTRGMVAWVHSGLGACANDATAIATARLIAAAPDLLSLVRGAESKIDAILQGRHSGWDQALSSLRTELREALNVHS